MVPFIIGGIALAATGYGVAKLLENDCICEKETEPFYVELDDENHDSFEDEILEKYELAKIELYNTTLTELKTALDEIKNLQREIFIPTLTFEKKNYLFEELTDEVKESFEKFAHILERTKEYMDEKLDILDSIIISESNYEKYSDEDKKLVDNLMSLCYLLDKVTQSQMTNDKMTISREAKRGFAKIETVIL